VSGSFEHNVKILNTSGILNSLSVAGSSFGHGSIPGGAAGGNGFLLVTQGSAVVSTGSISSTMFRNNYANGVLINSENTSNIGSFTVQNSSFDDNNIALQCGQFHTSSFTCRFLTNTIINDSRRANIATGGTSMAIVAGSSATAGAGSILKARIEGNVIGDAAIDGSGSSVGSGIRVIVQGLTAGTVAIHNNTIRECPVGYGIEATFLGHQDDLEPVPTSDVTVTNNNVDHENRTFKPGTSEYVLPSIYIAGDNQGTSNAGAPTVRADVRNNVVPSTTGFCTTGSCNALGAWIELLEYDAANATGILQLVDTPPASANPTAQLTSTNTGVSAASAGVSLIAGPINTPP
jgi:hypothetical protein